MEKIVIKSFLKVHSYFLQFYFPKEMSFLEYDGLLKDQLILKCPFGVFKSPKKPAKFFPGFLHFLPLIAGFYFDSLTLLFRFDLFLEARAEILEIFLLVLFWSKR